MRGLLPRRAIRRLTPAAAVLAALLQLLALRTAVLGCSCAEAASRPTAAAQHACCCGPGQAMKCQRPGPSQEREGAGSRCAKSALGHVEVVQVAPPDDASSPLVTLPACVSAAMLATPAVVAPGDLPPPLSGAGSPAALVGSILIRS